MSLKSKMVAMLPFFFMASQDPMKSLPITPREEYSGGPSNGGGGSGINVTTTIIIH